MTSIFHTRPTPHFNGGIRPVVVRKVQKADPLVLPGVGTPPSALGAITSDDARVLRDLLAP